MKRLIVFVFACLLSAPSCHEKDSHTSTVSDRETINSWIEENMKYYYLWNDRINTERLDKTEDPAQYFNEIIVPDDHLSHIENGFESLLHKWAETEKSGYSYSLYSTETDDVLGKITYVVKESPADKSGLTRGAIFTKINGTALSIHNYRTLTAQITDSHTLTVRDDNSTETDYAVPVARFAENPVFLDTIYNINNRKTGYLVYNAFTSDDSNFSQEYETHLNDVFGKFKDQNINELILDLRYNCTGHILNSMLLASLIVASRNPQEIYAQYHYNKSLQQIIKSEFGDDYLNLYYADAVNDRILNNIGDQLDRIFILTSPKTGIMSEILVNNLRLSMNVFVIGNRTSGENGFSVALYEDDPEKQRVNTWIIAPVMMCISDKNGNTDVTIIPNVEITEPLYDKTPLGDTREEILATALNIISGNSSPLSPYSKYQILEQDINLQEHQTDNISGNDIANAAGMQFKLSRQYLPPVFRKYRQDFHPADLQAGKN
ncbi:MAG: hypothetical protein LBH60_05700 [Prevotellaceae bacterium]|nr:hypothetical protein [Prevotellaceae bacterium]